MVIWYIGLHPFGNFHYKKVWNILLCLLSDLYMLGRRVKRSVDSFWEFLEEGHVKKLETKFWINLKQVCILLHATEKICIKRKTCVDEKVLREKIIIWVRRKRLKHKNFWDKIQIHKNFWNKENNFEQ